MEIKSKNIVIVPISKLKMKANNRNKHGQDQIEELAKQFKYQGFRNPLIVSNQSGEIVCGNGRFLAAKRAGLKELPVIYQDYDSPEQEYKHHVADNGISLWAELDIPSIKLDLVEFDYTPMDLGIKDFILKPELENNGLCDPDDVPEVVESKAKLGEIYQLGNHRLMCGDSIEISNIEKLMNGDKADMVFTSPPYNGNTHLDYGKGKNKKLYENNCDEKSSDEYVSFCHESLKICFNYCNGFIFWNVNYNAKSRFEYIKGIYPFIEKLHETIVWKKTGMPIPNGLTRNFEFIFCFKNGDRKHLSKEFKTEFNHWEITNKNSQDKENHRACFPVALVERGIVSGSEKDQIIFEPFGGSGSTLIACERTNRKCYMMELDPHYIDVIIARWEKFTGQKAELINV